MTQTLGKHSLALQLAALVAITPLAIDTYLPAIPTIAEQLNSDIPTINLTVSIYLLGFALGQIIGGPLSDRLGRKPVALIGLSVFIVSSLAVTQVTDATAFLVLRFLQALGGGHASVVAGAMVRDRFEGQESAKVFSTIGMIMMVAPLIAPAIGAVFLAVSDWQSIFVFLALYAGLMLWVVTGRMKETRVRTHTEHSWIGHYWHSYAAVFNARASLPHLFSQACVSGILFILITNSSFIYIRYFGVSESVFPLFFAAVTSCSIIAGRVNLHLLKKHARLTILKRSSLLQLITISVLGLYILFGEPKIWPTVALLAATITAMGFTYSNNLSLYLDHHGHAGGSANAIFGCSTFFVGALLGGLSSFLHDGTLLPIGMLMLVSSLCNLMMLSRVSPEAPA